MDTPTGFDRQRAGLFAGRTKGADTDRAGRPVGSLRLAKPGGGDSVLRGLAALLLLVPAQIHRGCTAAAVAGAAPRVLVARGGRQGAAALHAARVGGAHGLARAFTAAGARDAGWILEV